MPLCHKVLIQDRFMLSILTSMVIFENKCYVTDLLLFILLFLHAVSQHFLSLFLPLHSYCNDHSFYMWLYLTADSAFKIFAFN